MARTGTWGSQPGRAAAEEERQISLKSGSKHDKHCWRGQKQRSGMRRLVCKSQVCVGAKQAAVESGEQEPA